VQQGSKVAIVIAALVLGAALAPPALAANRIALIGCDLTASDGPVATFLQVSGEPGRTSNNPGFAVGGNGGSPGFAIASNGGVIAQDVAGRSCASVMADLVDDGFVFRSAEVSGRLLNQWVSIWQASN
jgi:hypothetical protein